MKELCVFLAFNLNVSNKNIGHEKLRQVCFLQFLKNLATHGSIKVANV